MSAPVDLDLLADYVGGALDGTPEAARIAELIAHDPAWRTAAAEMIEATQLVKADLAQLGRTPEPMPDDIAARFDELFVSPAMAPEAAPAPRPGVGERPLQRRPAAVARRRWLIPVAITAGALAIAGIAMPSFLSMRDMPAGTSEDAAAPMAAGGAPNQTASGKQYDRRAFATATRETADGRSPDNGSKASSSEGPVSSTGQTPGAPRQLAGTPAELQRLADPVAMTTCLNAVAVSLPGQPTAIDFAHFEGQPALIISITTVSGRWFFVAGDKCGINGANELYRAPQR